MIGGYAPIILPKSELYAYFTRGCIALLFYPGLSSDAFSELN